MTNCRSRSIGFFRRSDLDLHCLLRQGMTCSARDGLKGFTVGALTVSWINEFKHYHSVAEEAEI